MAKHDRYLSCGKCKPRDWKICPQCGRHYCEHKGHGICEVCFNHPVLPSPTEAGERMVRLWRTPYGAYTHQTSVRYYRLKDAKEWKAAADKCGFIAHLLERGHTSRWRDWYGRPCSSNDPTFELWVVVPTEHGAQRTYDMIRGERLETQVTKLCAYKDKPRSEWTYKEQEDWHRAMGTL